jgi:hypothetical protein
MVIDMLETTQFFEEQIKQCQAFATQAKRRGDRVFWLKMARRWEGLLRERRGGGGIVEAVKRRFERPIFAKHRRAA